MVRVGVAVTGNFDVVVCGGFLSRGGLRRHLARFLVTEGGGVEGDQHPPRLGCVKHAEPGGHGCVVVAQVGERVSY